MEERNQQAARAMQLLDEAFCAFVFFAPFALRSEESSVFFGFGGMVVLRGFSSRFTGRPSLICGSDRQVDCEKGPNFPNVPDVEALRAAENAGG